MKSCSHGHIHLHGMGQNREREELNKHGSHQGPSHHLKHLKAGPRPSHCRVAQWGMDFQYGSISSSPFLALSDSSMGETPGKRSRSFRPEPPVTWGHPCRAPNVQEAQDESGFGSPALCSSTETAQKDHFLQEIYNPPLNPPKGLNNAASTGFLWKNDSQEGWQQCAAIKY